MAFFLNIIFLFFLFINIYIYGRWQNKNQGFPSDTDDEMHPEKAEFRDLQCGPSLLRHAKGHWPNLRHPTTQTNKITAVFKLFLL